MSLLDYFRPKKGKTASVSETFNTLSEGCLRVDIGLAGFTVHDPLSTRIFSTSIKGQKELCFAKPPADTKANHLVHPELFLGTRFYGVETLKPSKDAPNSFMLAETVSVRPPTGTQKHITIERAFTPADPRQVYISIAIGDDYLIGPCAPFNVIRLSLATDYISELRALTATRTPQGTRTIIQLDKHKRPS